MSDSKDNHGFSVSVAQEIGVHRAIMLQHFRHLQIAFVEADKSALEIWIKRSRRALTETYPYLSEKEIRGCLDRLERDDYIRAKVDNALNYDRTKSYQLSKKGWELLGLPPSAQKANREQKASDKRANGFDKRAKDNVTKGPMNIGSCSSIVTSFVEGEETPTPAPNPSNLKEEKNESGLVAPPGENPETVKAEIPPLPKVAPKKDSPADCDGSYGVEKIHFAPTFDKKPDECEPCHGTGIRISDTSVGHCLECFGTGLNRNWNDEPPIFEVTAIASPTEIPGVTIVEAAPKPEEDAFAQWLPSLHKAMENNAPGAMQSLPRAATTIEAETKIAAWIAGEGLETVKYRFNVAKQRFDPDNAAAIAAHYCSCFTKNPANKERLLKDPVTHFSDGLFSYLKNEESWGRNNAPREGGPTRNGQTPPPSYQTQTRH